MNKGRIAKSLPTNGSIVIVETKYGQTRECQFIGQKFQFGKTSFTRHEIVSWKYKDTNV